MRVDKLAQTPIQAAEPADRPTFLDLLDILSNKTHIHHASCVDQFIRLPTETLVALLDTIAHICADDQSLRIKREMWAIAAAHLSGDQNEALASHIIAHSTLEELPKYLVLFSTGPLMPPFIEHCRQLPYHTRSQCSFFNAFPAWLDNTDDEIPFLQALLADKTWIESNITPLIPHLTPQTATLLDRASTPPDTPSPPAHWQRV